MLIKTIVSQYRRDFRAVYECEHCGVEKTGLGYDDDNFHRNVVPKMACESCGEKQKPGGEPRATRYPDGMQV